MEKLEPPRFLPNDIVFAIPDDNSAWGGFSWIGEYKISRTEIVPDCFIYSVVTRKHEPSNQKRYVYHGSLAGGGIDVELKHVFKDKDEFLKFITEYKFPYNS